MIDTCVKNCNWHSSSNIMTGQWTPPDVIPPEIAGRKLNPYFSRGDIRWGSLICHKNKHGIACVLILVVCNGTTVCVAGKQQQQQQQHEPISYHFDKQPQPWACSLCGCWVCIRSAPSPSKPAGPGQCPKTLPGEILCELLFVWLFTRCFLLSQ